VPSVKFSDSEHHFSGRRTIKLYGENTDNEVFVADCEVCLCPVPEEE